MEQCLFIVQHRDDTRWHVYETGFARSLASFELKEDAVEYAPARRGLPIRAGRAPRALGHAARRGWGHLRAAIATDTQKRFKVNTAIFNDPSLKSAKINIETFKGVAQLSGFVSSLTNIDQAVAVTRSIKGVTFIKNHMRLM